MRVAVLLVDAAALGHDLVDLGAAQRRRLLVGRGGPLGAAAGEVLGRGPLGEPLGELVLGEDGCCCVERVRSARYPIGYSVDTHIPFPGAVVVNLFQNSSIFFCGGFCTAAAILTTRTSPIILPGGGPLSDCTELEDMICGHQGRTWTIERGAR